MSVIPEKLTKESYNKPYPVSSLLKKLDSKLLDLEADYQRDEVWSPEKKTSLIQSILGGVTIPSIIINEMIDSEGNEKKIVIDGKQRLSAIRDFKKNLVLFYNEQEPDKKCKFSSLSSKYQDIFDDYSINCTIYKNLTNEEERDIFQRINYGVNLSIGETLKGMKTKIIPEIIKVKDDISKYLRNWHIKQRRESYNECTVALLALYNKDYDYVSKGKSCIKYIQKLEKRSINLDSIKDFSENIIKVFILFDEIYKEICSYLSRRKYKKSYRKLKWTDILVYFYLYLTNDDKKNITKKLSCLIKHLAHIKNENNWICEEKDSDAYLEYKNIFEKRSNTNVKNFFEDRSKCIDNFYKYLNRTHTKEERDKIYAKSGTIAECYCELCNKHTIYSTNFESGHIISKKMAEVLEYPMRIHYVVLVIKK